MEHDIYDHVLVCTYVHSIVRSVVTVVHDRVAANSQLSDEITSEHREEVSEVESHNREHAKISSAEILAQCRDERVKTYSK